VPVLVYNNRNGRDAELLERYEEPAWNNPVVRFFSAAKGGTPGRELLPRREGVWAAGALAGRLEEALRAAERPVPGWLALAVEELAPGPFERAVLAMPCFWRGEAVLGSLAGVRTVRAAFLEGHEVVDLTYDPGRLPLAQLLARASSEGCAARAWVPPAALAAARAEIGERALPLRTEPRVAPDSDHEHDLARSPLRGLALTPLQRVRVNAWLGNGRDPSEWLTPAQRRATAGAR
jgi:hypothetical protein